MATLGFTAGYCTNCHLSSFHERKPTLEPQFKSTKTNSDLVCECVCLCVGMCSHPGGLEVTDKSASRPINNACCPDSALTINTLKGLCCQGSVNSWVNYFTFFADICGPRRREEARSHRHHDSFSSYNIIYIAHVPRANQIAVHRIDFFCCVGAM